MAERFGSDLLLLEKLAAGGMAEVFRARQMGFGGFEKTVAVKRILSSFAGNEEFKEMFRQEANLSAQLQHPNIAQVFTNGEFDSYLFLVMEFVDGKNVRQLLARADKKKIRIPIEISCFIVCETAKGLDYAHNYHDEKTGEALEIVHRDMSPQNVMMSYDGSVKVVDFGIAKAAARSDTTRAGVLKGKFGYMAPEQAMGMKLDKRTDIFALGIILFELLTQRRLFSSDDDLKTLQLVKDCRVPRPSKYNPAVNPALDRIVLKALAKERHERYSTAGELYADLQRFLNQTYAKFIPTDFANFLRQGFAEDIQEDKKRREKINAEIPAVLASPVKRSGGESRTPEADKERGPAASDNPDSTFVGEGDKTELSEMGAKEPELPAAKGAPLSTEVPRILYEAAPALNMSEARGPLRVLDVETSTQSQVSMAASYRATSTQMPARRSSGRLFLYGLALALLAGAYWVKESPTSSPAGESMAQVEGEVPEERTPATSSGGSAPTLGEATVAPEKSLDAKIEPEVSGEEDRTPSALNKSDSKKALPGFLNLDSVPRATEIYINGKLLTDADAKRRSTPVKRFSLSPGQHEIRLKNSSFGVSWQGTVNVESDRISVKDVVLK